ncbi:MAG: ABC transporter ATP-binding protein [Anaerolineales bacterium]|jgi:ABC-2 type transport system ATP-binding protein
MIETNDLSKRFDDFLAVDGVSLNVNAGQVLALLGPNGAGKTTTVRMLTSVLRPTRGWARIAGHDVVEEPAQVRAAVGVLTEQHGLYGRMPGGAYLDFFGQVYGMDVETRHQQVDRLLSMFGLNQDRHRRVAEYSKGMRQKLALARALIHNPPVLLLDEPTSAMDPESARLVRDSISELRSAERAIILCTHNLVEAEELADQIAIIRRGKIIAQGSPIELKHLLLGPGEFEIHLATSLNGQVDTLLSEIAITAKGPDWFRYQTDQPNHANPALLRILVEAGLPVVRIQEVPRKLEQVYLRAINSPEEQ